MSDVTVEMTGETVGEAKWAALRELERMRPGLDREAVRFQVVSEGERGLLGVGYSPARVVASVDAHAVQEEPPSEGGPDESGLAASVRELLAEIIRAAGAHCRIEISEDDEAVTASLVGGELGLLIGRHGQTIDAIQYLANVIAWREFGEDRKDVVVDAAGYRERRRETLQALALRTSERVKASGEAADLEPMTSIERRIVHLFLKEVEGVGTRSEGEEPYRFVVVEPE